MTLIKSISGIRGTIGGKVGKNFTPIDVVKFTSAYGSWIKSKTSNKCTIVVGRDARISGKMISNLVIATLQLLGINIIDLGLSTTPTVEIMIPYLKVNGGIMITASHNPQNWNSLKLLNEKGEFISENDGKIILNIVASDLITFALIHEIGNFTKLDNAITIHIDQILNLPLVNKKIIQEKKFKIVVDCVNSTGGISLVPLLKKLGCEVIEMYTDPNGYFPHQPEPIAEHLSEIMECVPKENADLGIVVDPDVDRLVFVNEDGSFFGEEYTLVAIADYILKNKKGPTVSNLSSSYALREITRNYKQQYFFSSVGEINVIEKMKEVKAVIGGEGSGGIIYPELHYGRDSLVGVALFLTHLAECGKSCKELRDSYPSFFMSKKKIDLTSEVDVNFILNRLKENYKFEKCTTIDGLKIDFLESWIHFRKSNTESIVRIYAEALTQIDANDLADRFIQEFISMI